jgi:autotransporter-associated beta strand protein
MEWRRVWTFLSLLLAIFLCPLRSLAQTNFATLVPDGVWTWFNDPRAVFHNGTLYFGYVRSSDGRSVLSQFNLQTGQTTNLWTSSLTETDDHDVSGLQVKQDGTLLAIWARHGGDQFFSYRLSSSTNPVSPADWGAEQRIANSGAGLTYANPCQLTNESAKVYDFCRDLNYNPTVFTSTDGGATWSPPQLMIKTGTGSTRPYVKYCSDSGSRIDFLYTDAHPDNYPCSLYHMYYQGGSFYQTDGTFLTNFANLPILHDSGQRGSVVYQYNAAASSDPNQWIATARAWCWDIAYQTNGAPACVFQVKVDNVTGTNWSDARIYYYYARWTGTSWQKRFIAQAGRPLYNGQPDYGGGIAIDPLDVNSIYLASDAASPFDLTTTTNVPLGNHYEIWKGVTTNGGLTFNWQAVTTNSTMDNLRPYVPRRFGGEQCVLWFRGSYVSYTSFSTAIVGMFTTAVPTPVVTPPTVVPAPVIKKANNANTLNVASSWVGGVVPDARYVALWDNTVTAANSVAPGADLSWSGLSITNPGGAVAITGGNTLTLGPSGIDMSGATANLAISSGLSLGVGAQVWNVTNGRTLTLNTGIFTRPTGACLSIQGAGTVAASMAGFANDASENGGILGPWATAGSGANTAYAALSAGNILNYSGGTVGAYNGIPTGATAATNYKITTAGSVAYGAATRTLNTLNNAAGATTLTWGNSGSIIQLIANGILNSGAGTLTIARGGSNPSSGVQVGGNNNRELVLNAANAGITVSAPIFDNAGGASLVTVVSSPTNGVTLSGANTYTGGTTLDAGNLTVANTSGLGNSSGPLTVNGGVLDFNTLGGISVGTVILAGGTIQNGTLTATSYTANNAGAATVSANLAGASTSLTVNGPGTLTLSGANTYDGGTVVLGGTLRYNGSVVSGPVTVAGGTLTGVGSIGDAVTVQAGGTLAPGASSAAIGSLTISNSLTLQPGSATFIKLSKNGDGPANDSVTGMSTLACGGVIMVTNIGATPLAAGDTFKIFSAASFSGAFSAANLPALGQNLYWTNRLAVDGTLSVLSTASTSPTNMVWSVSGTNLTFSWPADHLGWRLLMQTNHLSSGVSLNPNDWATVPGSQQTNQVSVPVNPANAVEFYRLGYP